MLHAKSIDVDKCIGVTSTIFQLPLYFLNNTARQEVTDSPSDSQDETEDPVLPEVDNTPTDRDTPSDAIEENEKEEEVNVQEVVSKDDMLQAALALDNEFVLDGFDFSTGMSMTILVVCLTLCSLNIRTCTGKSYMGVASRHLHLCVPRQYAKSVVFLAAMCCQGVP